MTSDAPRTATFETTLGGSGNKAGIVIPDAVIDELAAGRRPAVLVDVNGYQYRYTVAVMGGQHLIGVSAKIRAETGLHIGDAIRVTLTVATEPRVVDVPDDLREAFRANPGTEEFFESLSNSLQRYHVDNITSAKAEDTRKRRIEKAIDLFLAGQKR